MSPGPAGRKVRTDRYGQGSRWRAVWTEPNGTRRRRSYPSKDLAQAHLDQVAVAQMTGAYISPDRGRITVRTMAEAWFAEQIHQRATSTQAIRIRLDRTLLPSLGGHELATVDRSTVQRAVTAWSKTLAPSTVRVAYVYLAGIFTLAVDERRIPTSPCRSINLPPVTREPVIPMTTTQVQALTDALWVPYRKMAVLAVASGMRGGELRGLTWDRITPKADGAMIRVDRQLTGNSSTRPTWGPPKTKTSVRVISIGPQTLEALGERGEGLVLTGGNGGAITRGAASTAWRAAAGPLGFPTGSGWHDLRHFHASLLIAGGASPVAVAHRLGHKDATETLKTYAHLWADDDERMRDATDGLVRLPEPPPGPQGDKPAGQG